MSCSIMCAHNKQLAKRVSLLVLLKPENKGLDKEGHCQAPNCNLSGTTGGILLLPDMLSGTNHMFLLE
jgi:hypothetical protein